MQSSQGLRTFSKTWYQSRSMHVFDVLLKKKTVQLSIAGNSYYIYVYIYIDVIVTVQLFCCCLHR